MIGGYGSSLGCLLPACFHLQVLPLVLPQFQSVVQEQEPLLQVLELLPEQVLLALPLLQ
jgi:hypothetical protein